MILILVDKFSDFFVDYTLFWGKSRLDIIFKIYKYFSLFEIKLINSINIDMKEILKKCEYIWKETTQRSTITRKIIELVCYSIIHNVDYAID